MYGLGGSPLWSKYVVTLKVLCWESGRFINSAPCAGLRRSNSLELLPEAQFDMLSVDEHNAAGQMNWSGELKH